MGLGEDGSQAAALEDMDDRQAYQEVTKDEPIILDGKGLERLRSLTGSWHVAKKVGEQMYYIAVVDGKLGWTTNGREKLSLSREEDAKAIMKLFPDADLIIHLNCF